MLLLHTSVKSNAAGNVGGGIASVGDGGGPASLTLDSDSTVTDNTAGFGGGGIANSGVGGTASVVVNDWSSITENTVPGGLGGGIQNDTFVPAGLVVGPGSASVTLNGHSSVAHNVAANGGGILDGGGAGGSATLTLNDRSRVIGNKATGSMGGGIFDLSSPGPALVTLNGESSVTGNSAPIDGGGVWNPAPSVLMLDGGTVTGNTPDDVGPSPGISSSFSAVAGGTSFTVTFAAAVNIPLVPGNFLVNGTALAAGIAAQTGPTTFLVHAIGVLKPGDVIAINGANPPTATGTNTAVANTSFTVPANVAPTVVSVQFFTNGHAIAVQFSKPVSLNGGVSCAGTCGALALANTSQDGTTDEWTTTGTITSADVLTITTAVTDLTAVALPATVVFSPTPSVLAPIITTVNVAPINSPPLTTVHGSLNLSAIAGAGNTLTVSAKPGSAADGALGSAFLVATAAPSGGQVALNVTASTVAGVTTVTISIPSGIIPTGAALVAAMNACLRRSSHRADSPPPPTGPSARVRRP